jgi:hypothetical protein
MFLSDVEEKLAAPILLSELLVPQVFASDTNQADSRKLRHPLLQRGQRKRFLAAQLSPHSPATVWIFTVTEQDRRHKQGGLSFSKEQRLQQRLHVSAKDTKHFSTKPDKENDRATISPKVAARDQ